MKAGKIEIIPVLVSRYGDEDTLGDGSSLPMGCLTAYIKHRNQGALLDHYIIEPLVNRRRKEWKYYEQRARSSSHKPTIWLFSCYSWNREASLDIAQKVKALCPQSLIIVGGPHIPGYVEECEEFLEKHSYIDIAVRGEGEKTLAEILEAIVRNGGIAGTDYTGVTGLTFRQGQKLIRTPDRVRSQNLDEFPSPYLTGEFEDSSFNDVFTVVIETNRGCPYGCTYCDWGSATLQKIRHFDLERVKKELDIIGSKRGICLHIADANFGAFQRDVDIAKAIVQANKKHGFPKRVFFSNAKNGSPIIADVVKVMTEAGLLTQGVVAIQTVDEDVLEAVNRSNIKNKNMEKLMDIFRKENLFLASELLIGLPGQSVKSHKNDLQYIFDRKITTTAYPVQVMPNSPMNEPSYRKKYAIKSDADGFVIETSTFTEQEYGAMRELFLATQFFYMIGVAKYLLYYLQMEHNILAMDFIEALLEEPTKTPGLYPIGYRVRNELIKKTDSAHRGLGLKLQWKSAESEFLFKNLDKYYEEIFAIALNRFGVEIPLLEKSTLKTVQMAVMPAMGKAVPCVVALEHDFVGYFEQIKSMTVADQAPEGFRKLNTFLPGQIKVYALKPKVIDNLGFVMTHTMTARGWELRSPLQFVKPRIQKKKKTEDSGLTA